jgi:hypothetical protein
VEHRDDRAGRMVGRLERRTMNERSQSELMIKRSLVDEINDAVPRILVAIQFAERGASAQKDFDDAYANWELSRSSLKGQLRTQFRNADIVAAFEQFSDAISEFYALTGTWTPSYRTSRIERLKAYFGQDATDWEKLADLQQRQANFVDWFSAWWKLREAAFIRKDTITQNILDTPLFDVDKTSSTLADRSGTTQHVIIMVHGIRDFALWQETVGAVLSANGFHVYPTNYGRFDLFRFLIPVHYFRRQAIEEVLNQIRIVKQQSEQRGHRDISIIAHSFGTYVVSYILKESFDLQFKRIIFCGGVVRYGFPFEQFHQRFEAPILNEVGTRDIWPAMAESITWGYGSAGTYGFRRPLVRDRWHNKAGHGYFLTDNFCTKYWIPFFESGEIISDNPRPESPRFWIQILSIFRIKYIILLLVALLSYYTLSVHSGPPIN